MENAIGNKKRGRVFKGRRERLNFSIQRIAKLTGLTINHVRKIEQGTVKKKDILEDYNQKLLKVEVAHEESTNWITGEHLYPKCYRYNKIFTQLGKIFNKNMMGQNGNSELLSEINEVLEVFYWTSLTGLHSKFMEDRYLLSLYDAVWLQRRITRKEILVILKDVIKQNYDKKYSILELDKLVNRKSIIKTRGEILDFYFEFEYIERGVFSKKQAYNIIRKRMEKHFYPIEVKAIEKRLELLGKKLKTIDSGIFDKFYKAQLIPPIIIPS